MDRALLFPNDKIGFVIAVLLLILTGIAMLLIRQDRRLARLEREGKNHPTGTTHDRRRTL